MKGFCAEMSHKAGKSDHQHTNDLNDKKDI